MEVTLMKSSTVVALVAAFSLVACKVEKTGDDTYKVEAPTTEAKQAGEDAKKKAKELGEKVQSATESASDKLRKEIHEHTAPSETTSTIATSTTTNGTVETTTVKTTTRRKQ
jgi:hypothetical protein